MQNGLQGVEEGIDQDGRVYTNNVKVSLYYIG